MSANVREIDGRIIVGDKPNMSFVSTEIGKRTAENELRRNAIHDTLALIGLIVFWLQ